MEQINDLDRTAKIRLGKIPDPFGPIAHDNLLCGATPAPVPGFPVDAFAELFGGLDGTGVSGGVRIADRVAFVVPPSLGEHTSQLDLARVGGLDVCFALAPPRLSFHDWYTGPVHLHIQDGNWFAHHDG